MDLFRVNLSLMISPMLLLRCGHVCSKNSLGDGRSCKIKSSICASEAQIYQLTKHGQINHVTKPFINSRFFVLIVTHFWIRIIVPLQNKSNGLQESTAYPRRNGVSAGARSSRIKAVDRQRMLLTWGGVPYQRFYIDISTHFVQVSVNVQYLCLCRVCQSTQCLCNDTQHQEVFFQVVEDFQVVDEDAFFIATNVCTNERFSASQHWLLLAELAAVCFKILFASSC